MDTALSWGLNDVLSWDESLVLIGGQGNGVRAAEGEGEGGWMKGLRGRGRGGEKNEKPEEGEGGSAKTRINVVGKERWN